MAIYRIWPEHRAVRYRAPMLQAVTIGALRARSFCERVIHAANIAMTEWRQHAPGLRRAGYAGARTQWVLRMNKGLMEWARAMFAHLNRRLFKTSRIPA